MWKLVSPLVVGVAHSDLSDLTSFNFCSAFIFHFIPLTYLTATKVPCTVVYNAQCVQVMHIHKVLNIKLINYCFGWISNLQLTLQSLLFLLFTRCFSLLVCDLRINEEIYYLCFVQHRKHRLAIFFQGANTSMIIKEGIIQKRRSRCGAETRHSDSPCLLLEPYSLFQSWHISFSSFSSWY